MRMKIMDVSGIDIRVSLEAETDAELHQLANIKEKLDMLEASYQEWDDMEGHSGIVIVAMKRKDGNSRSIKTR